MKADQITFAVVGNAFVSIAEEMSEALKRSSYSSIIREMMDFCCAIYDNKGRMVSTSPQTIPGLLGHMDSAVAHLLRSYPDEEIREGDVFIANDPYEGGGSHVPDVHVMSPIFWDGSRMGFAVTNAHHIDFGGPHPGGESIYSTSIFDEGLRIPMTKLNEIGVENRDITRIVATNVRDPRSTLGDLKSQVAACKTAERRLHELFRKYGPDVIVDTMDRVMDYSEAQIRAEIQGLPDASTRFTDYLEGGAYFDPVKIDAYLEVKGSDIIFDFEGTDPQVKGPINMLYSATRTCTLVAVKMFTHTDAPTNDGCFRPIRFFVPEGTVLNAQFPAACGIRHITMVRLTDMLLHAFAQLYPDRSNAGAFAGFTSMAIGGTNPVTKQMKVLQDDLSGASGGSARGDGISGIDVNIGNLAMLSAEACEIEYPIRVWRNELAVDSGGAGKSRGGLGVHREYEILDYEQKATVYSEQARPEFAPWSLKGGEKGASPVLKLTRKTGEELTFLMEDFLLQPGDVLSIRTGGGGGYGSPLERNKDLVKKDVEWGYISKEHAERYYKVKLPPGHEDEEESRAGRLACPRPEESGFSRR